MVHSSITDISAARKIARKDYKEFFVKSVVSHACDPENPDLLSKLTFDVTFTDDPGKTLTLPYADVKFVDVVKAYLAEHKKDLPLAYKLSHAASGPIRLRARKQSQFLQGYDTTAWRLLDPYVHLTSQQVAAKCLLRAGKKFFPCISRYDCFYSAIFALLEYRPS